MIIINDGEKAKERKNLAPTIDPNDNAPHSSRSCWLQISLFYSFLMPSEKHKEFLRFLLLYFVFFLSFFLSLYMLGILTSNVCGKKIDSYFHMHWDINAMDLYLLGNFYYLLRYSFYFIYALTFSGNRQWMRDGSFFLC